jgi:ribA/ribD-fused uncharacterized protein
MIDKFEGTYRFLSNFWPSQVCLGVDIYPTIEHAYQAAKFTDPEIREKIRLAKDAKEAKRLGKRKGMRSDWDEIKLGIMDGLLRQKFEDPELAKMLLSTGSEELVEGNWWGDTFWGVCKGKGENHLGKLLMKIREELNVC